MKQQLPHTVLASGCIKCKIVMVLNQAPGNEAQRSVGMAPRVLNLASNEDRLVEPHLPQHTPGEKYSITL
jgi:hypothetical protein